MKDGVERQGLLLSADRDVRCNFRIGVGATTFIRFSGDLTDFDYDHKGLFINMTGRYQFRRDQRGNL